MNRNRFWGIAFILIGLSIIAWAGFLGWIGQGRAISPTPGWQSEPVVPTALPSLVAISGRSIATLTPPQATDTPLPSPALPVEPVPVGTDSSPSPVSPASETPSASPTDLYKPVNAIKRFGVGVPFPPLEAETAQKLGLGWYLAWQVLDEPVKLDSIELWQMIRVSEAGYHPEEATIRRVAESSPGTTWLIGNEPDVKWQDNITPERYADLYHQLYILIKGVDPTAQVAIGGITQPTPLRYQYLELILSSYQARYGEEMPVDIWNIHNFILREERDSWGVEIPPGLITNQGILFEVEDHDDIETFKAQIIGFRQWMAERGQRDKPLIISEYGILMPADYGFGVERVKCFMYESYDFMLTAIDDQIGYPADENRLVQRWAWFSLADTRYPTGNMIDLETGELTELGRAHQAYISHLP